MARNRPIKVFWPLLLFLKLMSHYQQFGAEATHQQNEITGTTFSELLQHISKQNDKISEIEVRGKQHEKEMTTLKATVSDDKTEIRNLKNRVANLETGRINNEMKMKRPARLLPLSLLYGRNNYTVEDKDTYSKRFYGPPTSCSDLVRLGYTLNGFYLIKMNSSKNAGSIQTVYCRFHQPSHLLETENFEIFIGNLGFKTPKNLSVHFQVERRSDIKGNDAMSVLRFQTERLNIGRAMNMANGIFTAPVAGVYHFQFTGLKYKSKGDTYVHLWLNGKETSVAAYADEEPMYLALSLSTSLRLNVGDRFHLAMREPSKLHEGAYIYNHFTGWLVEEEYQ